MRGEPLPENNEHEKRRYVEKLLNLVPKNGDLLDRLYALPILYADYRWKWDDRKVFQELSYESFYSTLSTWMDEEQTSYILERAANLPKVLAFGKVARAIAKGKDLNYVEDRERYDKLTSRINALHSGTLEGLKKICVLAKSPKLTQHAVEKIGGTVVSMRGKESDKGVIVGPFTCYRSLVLNAQEEWEPNLDIFMFEHNNPWRKEIQGKTAIEAFEIIRNSLVQLAEKVATDSRQQDIKWIRGSSWFMGKLGEGLGFATQVSRREDYSPGNKVDFSQRQRGYSSLEDFWGQFVNFNGTLRKNDLVDFFMTNRAFPVANGKISRDELMRRYRKT